MAVSPDDKLVASGTHGGNINIWSVADGEKRTTLETRGKFVMAVAYSPNGQFMACGCDGGAIYVFDIVAEKLMHRIECAGSLTSQMAHRGRSVC